MSAAAPSREPWLYGPVPDLLLGCGLLYVAVFAGFMVAGPELRAAAPAWLLPLLVILVSMPHYGGTLVRVYEHRSERRSYAFFTVWSTLAVLAVFVASLHVALVGSLLFTLYLTWSPWHYTGQNYGIAVMLLGRRGVTPDRTTKRLLYTSFLCSYAVVFLTFHTAKGGAIAYNLDSGGMALAFVPIGIPAALTLPLMVACLLATAGALAWAGLRILREAKLRDLTPALLLSLTQALWFTVPMAIEGFGLRSGVEAVDGMRRIQFYVLWVAVAHSAQYLWVTSYYAKASPDWRNQGVYYAKVLLAGAAVWTIPMVLFAPGRLGTASHEVGLALLVASTVNVHHFILDGAIWKLRRTRIGNVLIRSGNEAGPDAAAGRSWLGIGVWAATGAALVIAGFGFIERQVRLPTALEAGDLEAARASVEHLHWIGKDNAKLWSGLGAQAARAGGPEAAIPLFERSLELRPAAGVYLQLGLAQHQLGSFQAAKTSLDAGLALRPDDPRLLLAAGRLELQRGNPRGAVRHLEHLAELAPEQASVREVLRSARKALEAGSSAPPAQLN